MLVGNWAHSRSRRTAPSPETAIQVDDDSASSAPEEVGDDYLNNIKVHVQMIADKSTLPPGASANAIKQFQKSRGITIKRASRGGSDTERVC